MKEVEIKFRVKLNDNNIPDSIEWSATEADFEGEKPCDTLLISMWDREVKNTMSIDLWEVEVVERSSNFQRGGMGVATKRQCDGGVSSERLEDLWVRPLLASSVM